MYFAERYADNVTVYNTLSSSYMLKKGTDVEFTCVAHANDVANLRYYFHLAAGKQFPKNVLSPHIDAKDVVTTLYINGVNEENEGEYECNIMDVNEEDPFLSDKLSFAKFTVSIFGK